MSYFTKAVIVLIWLFYACNEPNEPLDPMIVDPSKVLYTMQEESDPHEATWLQWPHEYQYGLAYRNSLDPTWVEMTRELVSSELVNLIVYNDAEQKRVLGLLNGAGVPLSNVRFFIFPTDDVWVRDNGPIYARDKSGALVIQDWGFNGWGKKADFAQCDIIPQAIANQQKMARIDINKEMVNEGGSVEIDGDGTLMACKSSILNGNRNPGMSQAGAEAIFTKYLGITNFIWLDGVPGLEITDQYIDGFARFGNSSTIVTMEPNDLLEFQVQQSDIDKLFAAMNKNNQPYKFLKLPLTKDNVKTTSGKNLGYKGSYCNYYIANTKVLVPVYNDSNDAVALSLIQGLYPTRTVVGIDVRNLYENGGMVHCVTQQQPK